MTVTTSTRDAEALTLTIATELAATPERAWQLWADPRQLERWWGPPGYPATFHRHEFEVGGQSRYYMTGPEGDRSHAWFQITSIDEPHRLELDDGFSDNTGEPIDPDDRAHITVTFEPTDAGTRMTVLTQFSSSEQLERLIAMGMQEGMALAMGQIDAILAEG
ncbi:SRPBCC family protein [Paramicrobacterium fandaimingii]|uniref:SRPBCC family protein n=1 Tax=Paramicrobacterium fandaimingii TaxID=2708079 RepID=UPI001421171D|nr:SRPBCC domain-containing protein [Microbacterium fandaimingii]